jgi:iron(III) transport system ATP-binding protein
MMQKLRVQAVRKLYGTFAAVDDISFDVEPGEVVTLLGPSGCGKTTTLRMIAGLEHGDGGEIYLNDRLLSAPARDYFVPPEERSMGMVFQNYAVWPHMTVGENVAFPLRMHRFPKSEIKERVKRALATVGLDSLEDRPSPGLSGGQQQRVALARAIVAEPEVLLLDEPLSNLDTRLRESLRFELRELQRRLGITTIFVTHDRKEAMILSDRIIVMRAGKVEQSGKPFRVYQKPATRFVLEFLGASNYLPAHVEEDGHLRVPDAADARIPVPEDLAGLTAGTLGHISFRAEDVSVHRVADADGQWMGTVATAAFLGDIYEYGVQIGSSRIHVPGPKYDPFTEGSQVEVRIRPGSYAFWPAEQCPSAVHN